MRARRPPNRRAAALGLPLLALLALAGPWVAAVAAAGPPFPDPENNRAVYDTAEALDPATRTKVESMIDAIEQRTGAEVVVYTQTIPCCETTDEAAARARALMDQWGVGRRGFDDGLVILYDLNEGDTCHGQVQLYAGPGFQSRFLTNQERQKIFEDDMLPLLRGCDLDGALLAAMTKVDAAATPEHAAQLDFFRQLNAVLGLLIAPLVAVGIVLWGLASWFRHGRDPVYLDDPSIHMPAPPPGLTPAAGAVVRDGRSTRRALTAASLDLAARGMIAFQAEKTGLLGSDDQAGHPDDARGDRCAMWYAAGAPLPPGPPGSPPRLDPQAQYRRDRARSRPLDRRDRVPRRAPHRHRRQRRLHRARRHAQARQGRRRLRQADRAARRRQRLVRRAAGELDASLGRPREPRHRGRRDRARRRVQPAVGRARRPRAGRCWRRGSCCSSWRGRCRRGRCPGR